ncbi:T9SS type A sorting domain-containing protein [Flavobacterium azooxidireducens]|uniref:T9SS type A sorting domain-containing protein n=1 Tax=Flavobacterium azooxidireducens TaxID=1871076 RepID=A0ABY4KH66_9FLAO|nr:LamG-like jellyroll fold domain-containing protein [Flavobacterium azooxidireducens]UPQ80147.1 T9SS type A sorting domain-containing protein [Flavobacterium azooxidireducens]
MKTKLLLLMGLISHFCFGQISSANLVAYYNFENSGANQINSNLYGLTPQNTNAGGVPSYTADGISGSCVNFNGSNTLVNDAQLADYFAAQSDKSVTISFWMKSDFVQDGLKTYVEGFESIVVRGRVPSFIISRTSGNYQSGAAIYPDQEFFFADTDVWNHIVYIYNAPSNNLKGYINNVLFVNIPLTGNEQAPFQYTNKFLVGAGTNSGDVNWPQKAYSGKIDEMYVFSRAITASEVQSLYNLQTPQFDCPSGSVLLTSQAEVDSFVNQYPTCTTIDGNLTISGPSITDITGLNQITTVNGALTISNTTISNGNIFNNLTQVSGNITIQSNSNLTTLSGFNALVNTGDTLQIADNQNITSITGFSNLVTVTGNLSILSTSTTLATTNISGFSNVQSVGYLLIRRTPLTNLSQLSSLTTILRGLSIDNNPNLTSIASLSSVTNAVNGNGTTPFRIFANPLLTSLDGINFSSVTNCLDVQISQLPLVTSLQPLSVINGQIGGLIIQFNTGLVNLNGLEGITNINGNVTITNNAALANLNGLQNITTITGSLGIGSNALITQLPNWNLTQVRSISLSNNAQLSSITTLSGITTLSAPASGLPTALSITSCQALTSLNGLQNLTTLNNANIGLTGNNSLIDISALNGLNVNSINGLTIVSNTSLSACGVSWVCGRLALNTTNVSIDSNANGCFDIAQVQTTCSSSPCPAGNVTLNSQLDVDTFVALYPNCTTIDGDLTISGTFINSLVGLSNLTTINGSLRITNNTALSSLNGLENITAINGVLNISFNTLITQLPNWNLTQVNSIAISTNTNLNSIASLTGVTSLTTANTSGSIMALTIFGCPALTSLNGLQNLSFINNFGVFIAFNNNLTDISALNNLNIASISSINVENNNSLTTCNVPWICNFLISNASNALLNNNATGCQSNAVVQAACEALSTTDFELESSLKIYPNPFNNHISIALGGDYQNVKTTLVDVTGKQFYSKTFTGNTIEINQLDALSGGIYFVTIELENGTSLTKKIVK